MEDIEHIDMNLGVRNPEDKLGLNWYKMWLMGNTKSEIIRMKCLIEGKESFNKLRNHVILAQIKVTTDFTTNNSTIEVENTPVGTKLDFTIPKEILLGNNLIWRYMSFSKFEDIIVNRQLHYSRLDKFSDKLEGQASFTCKRAIVNSDLNREQKLQNLKMFKKRMENNRQNNFALCWHINKGINHVLWEEYGGDEFINSICIRSSLKRFETEINKTKLPFLNEPVRYFDEPYFNQNAYWFPTLFKRNTYSWEKEYRSILFIQGLGMEFGKIKINPEKVISKIYLHSKSSPSFRRKVKELLRGANLSIPMSIAPEKFELADGFRC